MKRKLDAPEYCHNVCDPEDEFREELRVKQCTCKRTHYVVTCRLNVQGTTQSLSFVMTGGLIG